MESLNSGPNGFHDYKEAYIINECLIDNPHILWPAKISSDFYKTLTPFAGVCKILSLRILRALAFGNEVE